MMLKTKKILALLTAITFTFSFPGSSLAKGTFVKKIQKASVKKLTPQTFMGVRVSIMPLNDAAGNFEAIEISMNQDSLREGADLGRLAFELRESGSSRQFEGLNECLEENDSNSSVQSELIRILEGEEPNSCIREVADSEGGISESIPGFSPPESQASRISNCIIANREDVLQIAGVASCIAEPNNRFRPENILDTVMEATQDDSEIREDPNSIDKKAGVEGGGFMVGSNDSGTFVHSFNAYLGNGSSARAEMTGAGESVYGEYCNGEECNGGGATRKQLETSFTGNDKNGNSTTDDVVTQSLNDARQPQESVADQESARIAEILENGESKNDTKEPDWDDEAGDSEAEPCTADSDCDEDATLTPDEFVDEEETMPVNPEEGSEIPEECDRQDLEERYANGEMPDSLDPLIIPTDENGPLPAFLICVEEVAEPETILDCDLDNEVMPTDPDGGSLCGADGEGEVLIEENFNGDAGRTDPEVGPDSPDTPVPSGVLPGGEGPEGPEGPECDDPSDPGCQEGIFSFDGMDSDRSPEFNFPTVRRPRGPDINPTPAPIQNPDPYCGLGHHPPCPDDPEPCEPGDIFCDDGEDGPFGPISPTPGCQLGEPDCEE